MDFSNNKKLKEGKHLLTGFHLLICFYKEKNPIIIDYCGYLCCVWVYIKPGQMLLTFLCSMYKIQITLTFENA